MSKMLLVAILASALTVTVTNAAGDSCRGLEVDLCLTQIVMALRTEPRFTDRTRSEVIESNMDRQCNAFVRAGTCFDKYINMCTTPEQKQFIDHVRQAGGKLKDQYCTPGSKLRSSYVRHAVCLKNVMRDPSNKCKIDVQVIAEHITDVANTKDKLNLACCAYHRIKKCMAKELRKGCSDEAVDFVKKVGKSIGSRIPEMVCSQFEDLKDPICQQLPPFGSTPKGGPTTSVLNKVIRSYTNNAPVDV